MRKSSLFISAALTTFVLVILSGVASAYAYQAMLKSSASTTQPTEAQPVVQQVSTDVPAPMPTEQSAPAQTSVTAEQAANSVAKILGRTDLFSAEMSTLDGVPAYLITFTNGDAAYVGMDGQILSVTQKPVFISSTTSGGGGNRGRAAHSSSSNGSGGGSTGSHESESHDTGEGSD